MKRMVPFFLVPIGIMVVLVALRGKFIDNIVKYSLAMLNPTEMVSYIKNTGAVNSESAQSDDEESYESPFADFDITNPTPNPSPIVPIDTDHPIVEMTYAPVLNTITYQRQNCYVKNMTKLSKGEVEAELLAPLEFKVEKNSAEPQVLIMHTHATESYQNYPDLFYDPEYTCRDLDTSKNMVSVGKIMAEKLNALGYNTLHDATLHDSPSYNASYGRSKQTVEEYLAKYPSIKVVLDIHRDAIERTDGTRIKPVVTIGGKRYAQVMIISGADNGYLNMPNYKKNLRFSSHLQNAMETLYPGFTRPILFDYRNYNQQLTTGSILIEVGSHANTLEEAQNSAELIAYSLARTFENT